MTSNRVYLLVFAVLWSLQGVCASRALLAAQALDHLTDVDHPERRPVLELMPAQLMKHPLDHQDVIKGIFRERAVVESCSSLVDAEWKLNPKSIACKDNKERTIVNVGASADSMARWFLSSSRPAGRILQNAPSTPGVDDPPNPGRPGPGGG